MPTPIAEGIFADTNLWVNAAVPTAPHHDRAIAALGKVSTGTLWTSRQVVREFLAVMSRPQTFFAGNAPIADILTRARTIEAQCRVARGRPGCCPTTSRLACRGRYPRQTDPRRKHSGDHVGSWHSYLAHGQHRRLCPLGPSHRRARAVDTPTSRKSSKTSNPPASSPATPTNPPAAGRARRRELLPGRLFFSRTRGRVRAGWNANRFSFFLYDETGSGRQRQAFGSPPRTAKGCQDSIGIGA